MVFTPDFFPTLFESPGSISNAPPEPEVVDGVSARADRVMESLGPMAMPLPILVLSYDQYNELHRQLKERHLSQGEPASALTIVPISSPVAYKYNPPKHIPLWREERFALPYFDIIWDQPITITLFPYGCYQQIRKAR